MAAEGLEWDEEDDEPPLVAVPGPLWDNTGRHSLPRHLLDLRSVAATLGAEARGGTLFVAENVPLLSLLCLYSFFAAVLISVAAPFLPQELTATGASPIWVGIIFAAYPFTNLVVSPGCSLMCRRFGRRTVLLAGLIIEAAASISMGFVPRTRSSVYGFLFLRILQGVGAAFSYTALLADVAERLPSSLGVIMGLQEAVAGIGFMVGPPLGGVMYAAAGMKLPFAVMGCGLLTGIPLIPWGMPLRGGAHGGAHGAGQPALSSSALARALAGDLSVVNAVACTIITGIAFGFVLPTLGPHLHETLQASENVIGLLLALCAALYACAAPLAGHLADKLGPKWIMCLGDLLLAVAYLLLGPSPMFVSGPVSPSSQWGLQVTALCLIGTGAAFAFIPCLPDMEKGVKGLGPQGTEIIAGMYNGVYCMGESLGPLVGGMLVSFMPFSWAATVISLSLWLYVLTVAAVAARRRGLFHAASRALAGLTAGGGLAGFGGGGGSGGWSWTGPGREEANSGEVPLLPADDEEGGSGSD